MSLRRAWIIARKEFRHIIRDSRILVLVTLSPALLALCFSYVFSFDIERVTLAVLDMDRTQLSRQYVDHLTADGDFSLCCYLSAQSEADGLLDAGTVDAILVIPSGFASSLRRGEPASVQAIIDGSDTLEARLSTLYLDARTQSYAAALPLQRRVAVSAGVEVRSQAWYNPTLKSLHAMVPGLVAVALQLPSIALALSLSREREAGSFEGLVTTPVRGAEYLMGKLTAYIVSGVVSALLVLAVAALWFHVPFRASVWQFLALTCVFFLATMGLALLPGNLASSQQSAMMIMLMLEFVPSFFLSGLLLPLDRGSRVAQISEASLPATQFVRICRSLFLKGGPVLDLWPSIAKLAATGAVFVLLNVMLFRKRA